VLIALSDLELERFFPAGCLPGMAGAIRIPTSLGADSWRSTLLQHRPQAILSAWSTPALPEDLAGSLPLRHLCHCCGSVRNLVPRRWLEEGLMVSNWGAEVAPQVAECALLLILAGLRRVGAWQIAMHLRGGWKDRATLDTATLHGRRVGIHGLGASARELVRLLQPFGCQLRVYANHTSDRTFTELGITRCADLDALMASSDVLVELAAATPANLGIVDARRIGLLPAGAVFVNVGRGAVVDEQALATAAAAGRIHLALDVYRQEPLPADSPLRGLVNATLLPHIAGPTTDRYPALGESALARLAAGMAGQPIPNLVDLEAYDRAT
jgi:phosphoglycerate dehydrogenase-like enzyme